MSSSPGHDWRPHPGLSRDLGELHDRAIRSPGGPEHKLLKVALNALQYIQDGGNGTHALEFMATYPDLSDCQTSYLGTDPNRKPSHRLIWRETPPEQPGQLPKRDVIAFGERKNGKAYFIAGQRLGRPVGVRLADLAALREPGTEPSRRSRASVGSPTAQCGRTPATTTSRSSDRHACP